MTKQSSCCFRNSGLLRGACHRAALCADPLAVCPAWALTRRWKSSRELVTASEVKRRASDREAGVKEAWNEAAGRRTGTGYKAEPSRASGQSTAKPL